MQDLPRALCGMTGRSPRARSCISIRSGRPVACLHPRLRHGRRADFDNRTRSRLMAGIRSWWRLVYAAPLTRVGSLSAQRTPDYAAGGS